MPKLRPLTEEDRRKEALRGFIKSRSSTLNIRQKDMAKEIGTDQSWFCKKLKACNFSFAELCKIFKMLQATAEDMKGVLI